MGPGAPGETAIPAQPSGAGSNPGTAQDRRQGRTGRPSVIPMSSAVKQLWPQRKSLRNVIMAANRLKALRSSTQHHPLHTDTHTHQNKQPAGYSLAMSRDDKELHFPQRSVKTGKARPGAVSSPSLSLSQSAI